jgi:hypothetical protein
LESCKRGPLRFKLVPKHWWKNLKDEPLIERDDEIFPAENT